MIAAIFSVKDELTGKFHNPIFLPESDHLEDEVKRLFKSQVNNTTLWRENPEDFSLWRIGSLDDTNGYIAGEMQLICNGRSVNNGD